MNASTISVSVSKVMTAVSATGSVPVPVFVPVSWGRACGRTVVITMYDMMCTSRGQAS